MTKKDYIKLADVLKRHKLEDEFIFDLCNMLYMDNKNFNTQAFLKAINNIETHM